MTSHKIINAECFQTLCLMEDDSVDLVLTSPPYEDARFLPKKEQPNEHGWLDGEFRLKGQAWVDWLYPIVVECCRVSRGLVCFVVEGRTKNFSYSGTPLLLAAKLLSQEHRFPPVDDDGSGPDYSRNGYNFPIHLRKPLIYRRVGIPGSGGPDYFRNDYEFVITCSKVRKLPWSDPLATASPPKYRAGGNFSHQTQDGRLTNGRKYPAALKLANPGNILDCHGGGGHLGSKLAHVNEAPFPEKLCDFIIRSFCPPANDAFGGIVLDPFMGSGTVLKVAALTGRNSIGIDIRRSQYTLTRKRLRLEAKAKSVTSKARTPPRKIRRASPIPAPETLLTVTR